MIKYLRAMLFTRKPEAARARVGAMALRAKTETEEARRRVIESRLPMLRLAGRRAADHDRGRADRRPARCSTRAAACGCSTRSVRAARCRASGRRSRSTAAATWTAASGRPPTRIWRPGTTRVVIIAPLVSGYGPIASPVNQARTLGRGGREGHRDQAGQGGAARDRQERARPGATPGRRPGGVRTGRIGGRGNRGRLVGQLAGSGHGKSRARREVGPGSACTAADRPVRQETPVRRRTRAAAGRGSGGAAWTATASPAA